MNTNTKNETTALSLAKVYAKKKRIKAPITNNLKFGMISFSEDTENILVSMEVMEFTAWSLFPDSQPKIKKTLAALNDPKIGGMFETQNHKWLLNEKTGKLYLRKNYSKQLNSKVIYSSIDDFSPIFNRWRMSWVGAVGDIKHQGKPTPKERITLSNDPYSFKNRNK